MNKLMTVLAGDTRAFIGGLSTTRRAISPDVAEFRPHAEVGDAETLQNCNCSL